MTFKQVFLFLGFISASLHLYANDFPVLDIQPPAALNKKDWYFSGAYQIGLHKLDAKDGYEPSSIGEGGSFAIGYTLIPIVSLEGELNVWSVDEEDDEPLEHALLHDFHFYGISFGVNGVLHLPNFQGPYVKAGRHCWSASVSEIVDFWNGQGCSNKLGVGVNFNESKQGFYLETSRIRYKRVDSWFLSVGVRY